MKTTQTTTATTLIAAFDAGDQLEGVDEGVAHEADDPRRVRRQLGEDLGRRLGSGEDPLDVLRPAGHSVASPAA